MEVSNIRHNAINLPNLTPLRAFAAMAVVIFHYNEITVQFVSPEKTMLFRKCYLMVDLFFIMSGFIMLHVYGDTFSKGVNLKSFGKFIGARFARLYPLHLFTLFIAVAMFYLSNEPVDPISARINNPIAIITQLFMLHSFGIHDIFTWNVPSWSISAEWWSYMVFPFLALLLGRKKLAAIILIALLGFAIYFSIEFFLPRVNPFDPKIPCGHDLDVTYDFGYLRGLAGFMMGMLTYVLFKTENIIRLMAKDWIGFVSIVITLVALHFGLNDLLYIPILMLLVLSFSKNEGLIHKICLTKPLQYLGDISYSIYMVHILLIFVVGPFIINKLGNVIHGQYMDQVSFFPGLLASLIFLSIVILVSTFTYYFIEKPSRRWINKKLAGGTN